VFDIESGERLTIRDNGIGGYLLSLISLIEEKLNNLEKRELVSKAIGKGVPNPVEDYITACIKVLKEEDQIALKLLKLISEEGWDNLDSLIEKAKEQHGLEIKKEKFVEHLKHLEDIGLLDSLTENRVEVKEKYRDHVLNLTRIE